MPPRLPDTLNRALTATATITTAELFNEGKSAANSPVEFPFARINEILDGRHCPLCASVHGRVVKVGSADYKQWRQPSHINCRRTMSYIRKDVAGTKVTFTQPPAELIQKHGHYHVDPEKHAALRVPATPAGRQFIVRRVKDPKTGEVQTRLDYAPWWRQVPEWKRDLVLQARATADEGKFRGILAKLGLEDLKDPETLRQATLLGLKDRVEGLVTELVRAPELGALVKTAAGRVAKPVSTGPKYPLLHDDLQKLTGDALEIWGDSQVRRQALQEVLDAHQSGDAALLQQRVQRLDEAVVRGLELLGFPRGPVQSVEIRDLGPTTNGVKFANCSLVISPRWLEARLKPGEQPDGIFRTWVHESLHGRTGPYNGPMAMAEYRPWGGYEEGMVEGLARLATRDRAGMVLGEAGYNYPVRAYEVLAEELGVPVLDLWREVWQQPIGAVRRNLPDIVERIRAQQGAQPLSPQQRHILVQAGDFLFSSSRHQVAPDEDEARRVWRLALKPQP